MYCLFGIMIFEKYPIYSQMGYVPRQCPNMDRKYGVLNFSLNVVNLVLNRKNRIWTKNKQISIFLHETFLYYLTVNF